MANMNRTSTRRQKMRRTLFEKQAGRCYWCQGKMTLKQRMPPRRDYATFDHLRPVIHGGTSSYENVVLSCHPCNLKRGDTIYQRPAANGQGRKSDG
jgi:5-methylcytosine-specific restriction endonuclease McrA